MKNKPYEKNLHQILNRDKYQENLGYLQSLKFLKNKDELLQLYNPRFPIAVAQKYLIAELEKRKISYSLDPYGYCLRIFSPNRETPHLMHGINFGLNATSVVKIFKDKILTNEILRQDGFTLPREYILEPKGNIFETPVNNYEGLLQFTEKVGFPLIVKPNKGERGNGVMLLSNLKELEQFYQEYSNGLFDEKIAVIQEKVKGNEYRVIYLDGEILLTYMKQPFTLVGDGKTTLEKLLYLRNLKEEALEETKGILAKQGYLLTDIPAKDTQIQPYQFINDLSEQDQEVPFTEQDQEFLKKIAKSFGARFFGLDIISEGAIHEGSIIELNAKPDVLWARKISPEFNTKFWSKIIDATTGTKDKVIKKNDSSFDAGISEEEFERKVHSLIHLQNKTEILNASHGIKHGVFILLDEIEKSGFPYTIDEYGFVMTIQLPSGKNRIIYNADYGFDSSSLRRIFEDKIYTSKILRNGKFPVPNDMIIIKDRSSYSTTSNNTLACLDFAKKNGYPLIFKPNDGSLGVGVQKIFNQEQLLKALEDYNASNKGLYLLQQYIPGKDYRVIYLDGEILAAYERIPPKVVGNGISSIGQLIDKDFQDLEINKITTYLQQQNLSLDSVLPQDFEFNLLPTANIATGGFVREVQATETDRLFLERVAKYFGARYFGVDILSNGELADGVILEINKSPITKGISTASEKFRTNYPKKIWDTIKKDEGF
ncbi:hypothetical protein BSK20_04250 [SR1 bacterium human oral taxon HOT-345]|nr:hypothetical protein BSK20_04250 [SR1 bacterium human oral taxon HOT-345]